MTHREFCLEVLEDLLVLVNVAPRFLGADVIREAPMQRLILKSHRDNTRRSATTNRSKLPILPALTSFSRLLAGEAFPRAFLLRSAVR